MNKKYLSKSESAAYLGYSIKEFEKIKCRGWIKEFNIEFLKSPRFRVRDLDYFNKHNREMVR
jgi:hypothetical protein